MNATKETTLTVHRMLFGEAAAPEALARTLRDHGVVRAAAEPLGPMSKLLLELTGDRLAGVVGSTLRIDVAEVIASGWRKHEALVAAARRTVEVPGSEELVDLAVHRISSTHEPRVDLVLDETPVLVLRFRVEITIDVHAVCGVVTEGRLTALRSGRADVGVRWSWEDVELASVQRELDLGLLWGLDSGLPLLEPAYR